MGYQAMGDGLVRVWDSPSERMVGIKPSPPAPLPIPGWGIKKRVEMAAISSPVGVL